MDTLDVLKNLVANGFSRTTEGAWLNEFDWEKVPVTFCAKLPFGVVGAQFFGRILLLDSPDPGQIFSIYVHELRHVWQREKAPLLYYIGKLYRPLIENDADKFENIAEEWYETDGKNYAKAC